jgi:hypothetical protein
MGLAQGVVPPPTPPAAPLVSAPAGTKDEQIAALRQTTADLQRQLAEVTERLEQLRKKQEEE